MSPNGKVLRVQSRTASSRSPQSSPSAAPRSPSRRSLPPRAAPAVRVSGVCSQSSTSKLKLNGDDGRIEVEFEVDQNRNGVPWKVTLSATARSSPRRRTVTRAPSGSFSADRVLSGAHGEVVAVATRAGERCAATARI